MSKPKNNLDIYLHFPFCENKCAYCYINTYKSNPSRNEQYVKALIKEIESISEKTEIPIRSVFWGGGSPSLMTHDQLMRISSAIRNNFNVPQNCVFTIESTPNEVTDEKIESYHAVGISRVSVGIQSFNENVLKAIGRPHTPEIAVNAIHKLRQQGIRDVCIELMWAIIPFPLETLLDDMKIAAELPIDMLTTMWYDIYQKSNHARRTPLAAKQYEKEFPNNTRNRTDVFAGHQNAFYSIDKMIDVFLEANDKMSKEGFRRVAIDELRRSNFDIPPGLCLNGPGLSYTDNGGLLGFGYDALSSIDNKIHIFNSGLQDYIKNPLSKKNTCFFPPEVLVWYRVIYDIVVPGEFDLQEYLDFAPSESEELNRWIEHAISQVYFIKTNDTYKLTDQAAH